MAGFKDLDAPKVFRVLQTFSDREFDKGLQAFRELVNQQEIIRLFVEGSSGWGHQSATIHVLRTLVESAKSPYRGFEFNGTVEICYRQYPAKENTFEKIKSLLPEVKWNQPKLALKSATLVMKKFPGEVGKTRVTFAFTGGADSANESAGKMIPMPDEDFIKDLNADYFLRLQPYLFGARWNQLQLWQGQLPRIIQFTPADESEFIPQIGLNFWQRAWYLPPLEKDIKWQKYVSEEETTLEFRERAKFLQWVLSKAVLKQYDVCVLYSFHHAGNPVLVANPDEIFDALINVFAALRVVQDQREAALKKSVIVVNLDDLDFKPDTSTETGYNDSHYPSFKYLLSILQGNLTKFETSSLPVEVQGIKTRAELGEKLKETARPRGYYPDSVFKRVTSRQEFFKKLFFEDSRLDRPKIYFAQLPKSETLPETFIKDITRAVDGRKDRIYFVQAGRVRPEVFNFALLRSTLPPIFEGPNTANIALANGRTYLHVSNPRYIAASGGRYSNYPSRLIEATDIIAKEFDSSVQHVSTPLTEWKANEANNAPTRLGRFISRVLHQEAVKLGALYAYITKLREFYTKPYNDKLRIGINYLGFVHAGVIHPLTATLGTETNELDRIFDAIQGQLVTSKKVNLFGPDVLGRLDANGSFYRDLLGDDSTGFLVRDAKVDKTATPEGQTEAVVLTGETDVFVGGMSAVITFSHLEGHVRVLAKYTSKEDRWTPDGLPWISLTDPFLEFDIVEGGLSMAGSLGGTVTLGGKPVILSIALPLTEGLWLLRATPDARDIGVAQVYDFFAGVNLLSVFPREIATLGGLHLTAIEGVFDSNPESRKLEYLMAEAETAAEFALLDNLKLAKIGLQIVVQSPTNSPSLSGVITGEFKIGESAVVALSASAPELRFNGALSSGEINFVDLVNIFKPGVSLPDLPLLPTITGFKFSYDQPTKDWEVGCDLTMPEPWGLDSGGSRIVQLDSIGFLATDHSASLHGTVTILPNVEKVKLQLFLSAGYDAEKKAWQFAARQTGGALALGELAKVCLNWTDAPEIDITDLDLTFDPANQAYTFTARTAGNLDIPFLGLKVGATVRLASDGEKSRSGEIAARVTWRSIELGVTYAFENEKNLWKIAWEGQSAEYQNGVTRFELRGLTVGDLVGKFIYWATGKRFGLSEPWNVLDKINLDGLVMSFDFTKQIVSVTVPNLNINLGFLRINNLILTYRKTKEGNQGSVEVSLTGSFPWKMDGQTDELKWDAADPESAPAPPGSGKSFLDLRLLALGQHVAISGSEHFNSIAETIDAIRKLPAPSDNSVPVQAKAAQGQPYFDAGSSWLIAADFGLLQDAKSKSGHALQMSLVLNDPVLYGIRVALAGDAAKILNGLEFEIMYRRISDTVGVYQTEVTLPDAMRHLNLGAYAVTLPVLALQVYTNGDFLVDFGFPWNGNFTRSFTVEGMVPPGIPMIGLGGFYFGKLSAETSEQLPAATAPGRFNPVIVFGFGLQVGVGKSLDKGPLKASFSLTILGILEGVIARWNPQKQVTGGAPDQLQGAYYFKLNGTVGIIGKLRGAVDFSVVKATVYVEVKVIAQICVESYRDIPVTVLAAVDIRASLQVNFGIFKITINFSFRAQIKETFVIHNPEANKLPPWNQTGENRLLETRGWNNLTVARRGYRSYSPAPLNWDNYAFGAARVDLAGHLVPMLTARYSGGKPEACYVAALFLETVGEAADARDESRSSSFQKLCEEILRWTIAAARRDSNIRRAKLDRIPVSKDDLDAIILALGDRETPVPISAADASRFMQMCFNLNLSVPPDKKTATDADQPKNLTVFPMVPELHLRVSGVEGLDYPFNAFTTLSDTYVANLRARFDSLAEQVEDELDPTMAPQNAAPLTNGRESMASFCFADYFLLLARQMAQSARDAISNFQYPITAGQSIFDIVGNVNAWSPNNKSQDRGDAQDYQEFSPEELFRANADHPLNGGKQLHLDHLTYQVAEGDTLTGIVEKYRPPTPSSGFAAEDLARRNAQPSDNILTTGKEIKVDENNTYIVQSGDTLQTIADQLSNGDVAKLIKDFKLESLPGLLKPLAVLDLPEFVHQTAATDTLASIAARYSIKVEQLTQRDTRVQEQRKPLRVKRSQRKRTSLRDAKSTSDSNLSIADLFAGGDGDLQYLRITHREQFTVAALLEQIRRDNASTQLSGMASRYMLHGLRLPTGGITPRDETTRLRPVMGLYELTGQQFPIPSGAGKDFSFTLGKTKKNPAWIRFAGQLAATELIFTAGAEEAQRIQAVQQAATSGIKPELIQLGALDAATASPAIFPLRSMMRWQCAPAADFELSYGQAPKTRDELRIWWLPEGIFAFAGSGVATAAAPRLSVKIATYDDAKCETAAEESKAFEYATLIDFAVKKLAPSSQTATARAAYELIGAGDHGTIRLERLLRAQVSPLSGSILYQDRSANERSAAKDNNGLALQSGDVATTFISQVNLTTYTQPGAVAGPAAAGAPLDWQDFAKRLWRGSITRSGGFYLFYADSKDQGLPERIFNDRDEARIWVLLRYNKPTETDRQTRPCDFMNCVITGDAIDVKEESSAAVFLQAAPAIKRDLEVKAGDSLETIAAEHFMSAIDVAMENSDCRLVAGYPITIDGATYMVSSPGTAPGSRLRDIADYFNTSVEAIYKTNPDRANWPEELSPGDAIRLPSLRTTVDRRIVLGGTSYSNGDTMAKIATYHGCTVADIACANADARGLIELKQKLSLSGGPTLRAANGANGTVAVGATRDQPKEPDLKGKKPEEIARLNAEYYLQQMFSMLRYQVCGNCNFDQSIEGLPMGPVKAEPRWSYRTSIPYARLPNPGEDAPAENPYAHIGDLLQVEYCWQDIFGNEGPTPPTPPNQWPVLLGYTDPLIGLSAWPGVSSAYHVTKDSQAIPELVLVLHFDASRYEQTEDKLQKLSAHADDKVPAWQRNAQLDLKVFTRLCQQLEDASGRTHQAKFSLETSLLAQPSVDFSSEQIKALRGWISNIRVCLEARAQGQKKRLDASTLSSFEMRFPVGTKDQLGLNPAQIFALTVALRMRRPEIAVHPTLRNNRDIFDVLSEINPAAPPENEVQPGFKAANKSLDDLRQFARAFEASLDQAEPTVSFKIASGVPRGSLSDAESRTTLWVVRLSQDTGNGISYKILHSAAPLIFAPRPLATKPITLDGHDYDMDALCRGFSQAFDELLSFEYAVPARALKSNCLEPLLRAKGELATAFSRLVEPVFKNVERVEPEGKSAAEGLLRQRLLVRLSSLYDAAAIVQFNAQVKSEFAGDLAPRLYGTPTAKPSSNTRTHMAFSSAKLSLAGATNPCLLTFVADITDQAAGSTESYLPLDLEFKTTHIEHEIDEGMDGYQPSSWLAFVIPPEALKQDLGRFNLPRLLRVGPKAPNLKHQTKGYGRRSSTSLASLLSWDYQFSYSQNYHEPQDKTKSEVVFGSTPDKMLDDQPNILFSALVKFAAAYPRLLQTLRDTIAQGEAAAQPFADITALIDEVAVAAKTVLIDQAVRKVVEPANDAQKYAFTIEEKPIDLENGARSVLFLGIAGKPPDGVGEPWVRIDGYVTEAIKKAYDFGFVFKRRDEGTLTYLSAEEGRSIPERTVILPGLNILARENATLSVWIVRNEGTVDPLRATNPQFVYESSKSEPGFRVYPMIEIKDEIKIHEFGAKVRRSLAQHLGTFWSALFAESSASECTLQLECAYSYQQGADSKLPALHLPVFFRPPAQFQLPTKNDHETIPAAVENLAKAIGEWAALNQPSQTQANLRFDITIFASTGGEHKPLLQLHNAVLAVSSLEPGWVGNDRI